MSEHERVDVATGELQYKNDREHEQVRSNQCGTYTQNIEDPCSLHFGRSIFDIQATISSLIQGNYRTITKPLFASTSLGSAFVPYIPSTTAGIGQLP